MLTLPGEIESITNVSTAHKHDNVPRDPAHATASRSEEVTLCHMSPGTYLSKWRDHAKPKG